MLHQQGREVTAIAYPKANLLSPVLYGGQSFRILDAAVASVYLTEGSSATNGDLHIACTPRSLPPLQRSAHRDLVQAVPVRAASGNQAQAQASLISQRHHNIDHLQAHIHHRDVHMLLAGTPLEWGDSVRDALSYWAPETLSTMFMISRQLAPNTRPLQSTQVYEQPPPLPAQACRAHGGRHRVHLHRTYILIFL